MIGDALLGATPQGAALGALSGIAGSVASALSPPPPPDYSTAAKNFLRQTSVTPTITGGLNQNFGSGGFSASNSPSVSPSQTASQKADAAGGQGNSGQAAGSGGLAGLSTTAWIVIGVVALVGLVFWLRR